MSVNDIDDQLIEVENITNASVVIKCGSEKLVIDPWFSDAIYLDTWHNFPRVEDSYLAECMADTSYCLITHLHKDHFDIKSIKKYFSKETIFLVPKVFGFQVINATLIKEGFENVSLLECSNDYFATTMFNIRALPPLNISGLEK